MASLGQIIFCSMVSLILVFSGLIIIIMALAFSGKLSYVLSSNKSSVANFGENHLLSCYLDTETKTARISKMSVTWEKKGLSGDVYRFKDGAADLKDQSPQFKGRAKLFPEALVSGNASLMLTAVRNEDQGEYTCSISSSAGGGSVTIHLRTAAFSAPTFNVSKDTLLAAADRWFPQPNVRWLDYKGNVLNGSTTLKPDNAGIFIVETLLEHINISDTYTLRIENDVKIVVSEATITDLGVTQKTYFFNNKASLLETSLHLSIGITVLSIYNLT